MKRVGDIVVVGFAMFAMFFGAGNLIFPPALGRTMGSSYPIAILGFVLTGVGLPLLGILACAKCGGSFLNIASRVGKKFSTVVGVVLIFTLGPLLAVPRTAATTFELAIRPLFPTFNPIIFIVAYFAVNILFTLRPSTVVDIIGKYLTPILLVLLTAIIVKGVITPIGEIANTEAPNVLASSLQEGYQTMDAIGSVFIGTIIINAIRRKGYQTQRGIMTTTLLAGLISTLGLAIVYGGLTYLGAQTTNVLPGELERTTLVIEIARGIFGSAGSIALGTAVGVACLTTSIGILTTAADFFNSLTKGRISYRTGIFVMCLISTVVASMGVENIVRFAVPILSILYPIVIVLVITALLGDFIKSDKVVTLTTYTTLTISVLNTVSSSVPVPALKQALDLLPLNSDGFGWIIPSILMFVVATVFEKAFTLTTRQRRRQHTA